MIGVFCDDGEKSIVQEFFQLFKTPWEFFVEGRSYGVILSTLEDTSTTEADLIILYSARPGPFDQRRGLDVKKATLGCVMDRDGLELPIYGSLASFRGPGETLVVEKSGSEVVALRLVEPGREVVRVGYDLFREIDFLLSNGQPLENAPIPSLEAHIALLRGWIVDAGIPLVEIPPIPYGYRFIACLTHDVDFIGIRRHWLDHTLWGFIYRALVGSLWETLSGRKPVARLIKNWLTVLSLPLVYAGLIKDPWDEFEKYADIERGLSSTFFVIPFKHRAGDRAPGAHPARRATRYDIGDVQEQMASLISRGFEIGLHGLDAWHNVDKAREEMKRILEATGQDSCGVRIHWLCFERGSPQVLEQAGFDYDSTWGYNETIGYRVGTTQAFRPLGVTRLLELPLHIQDTALFYPGRSALTDGEAWELCEAILGVADRFGGVVTVLWHTRSLSPERLWGDFYHRLLQQLHARGAWFGTAREVVQWFRRRRLVRFEDCRTSANILQLDLGDDGHAVEAGLFLRVHRCRRTGLAALRTERTYVDIPWHGEPSVEIPLGM